MSRIEDLSGSGQFINFHAVDSGGLSSMLNLAPDFVRRFC